MLSLSQGVLLVYKNSVMLRVFSGYNLNLCRELHMNSLNQAACLTVQK